LEGDTAVYRGDQLYDYINGGAPQFIEYGFVEVVTQELTYNDHTYIFDVYRMQDALAAFGIFSTRRPQRSDPIGDFTYSSFTTYQGLIAHGPYLIEIAAYESIPETAREMAELARLGTADLDPSLAPDDLAHRIPFTKLPIENRLPGTEKLARGPVGLRTALGAAAAGPFSDAVKAVQAAIDPPATESPLWLIAGYHPQESEGGVMAPATTLIVLVSPLADQGGVEARRLLSVARKAIASTGEASAPSISTVELPGKTGCIVIGEEQPHLCAMLWETDLMLCASRLPAQVFRTWALEVMGTARAE